MWAYIIFKNNSSNGMSKKISVFLIFVIFFSPHFWHPMGMTAPLAFAYTAYAQGRLWANH